MNNLTELNYEQKFEAVTGENFNKFYNKYFPKLVWKIQTLNINKLDAEDLANMAFIQSVDKIHQYKPEEKNSSFKKSTHEKAYSTWMFKIGLNLGRKFKQDNAKYLITEINENSIEEKENLSMQYYINRRTDELEIDLESEYISKLKGEVLLSEIEKLNPIYKSVIELSDIDGFSYDEVCELLDMKLHTVKNRLFHGRAKLHTKVRSRFNFITENC